MIFKKIAVISLFSAIAVNCYAQEEIVNNTGWYLGGYLGTQASELEDVGTRKNTDTSFGVFGGYNFTPWFGLETSFLLNETDVEDKSTTRSAGFINASIAPKFTLAINDTVAVYVKAGLSSVGYSEEYRSRRRYSDDTESWAGTGSIAGVGAEYQITNGVRLRLSYDQVRATLEDVDDYYADKDVTLFQTGLGVYYQF
jgi:opacity protein-like surface antigen